MQTGFFAPKDKPLRVVLKTMGHSIPIEMIGAYVPYQSHLDLETAAAMAQKLDAEAAEALQASAEQTR